MAPKKTRKLVKETVVEKTTQDLDVLPEPMREEEQDHSEEEGKTHGYTREILSKRGSFQREPT
jgi:hypothetical protein